MSDKQVELIIKNQELQIALLSKLLESQPTLNVAEVSKAVEYRQYNTGI